MGLVLFSDLLPISIRAKYLIKVNNDGKVHMPISAPNAFGANNSFKRL